MNGEKKTGVTTFFINEKIDTGSILFQEQIEISDTINVGDLHDKLMILGSELIVKTIQEIESKNYTPVKQPSVENKTAPKLNKDNCKIDWNESLQNIYNKIRGLNPYPGAWTTLNNNDENIEIKIYNSEKIEEVHALENGRVVFNKKEIKIAVKNGYLNILELKIAGKRKMDAKSLLNGFTFCNGSIML